MGGSRRASLPLYGNGNFRLQRKHMSAKVSFALYLTIAVRPVTNVESPPGKAGFHISISWAAP
jgi:hypothetical protein